MRILVYNNTPEDLEKFTEMIKLYPIEIFIDKVSDFNETIYMFEKHTYDKVFIDFSDDIGKKIVISILKINPNQKLFLLNDEFNCIDLKDCESCKQKHNKNTIIKPLMQHELTRVLSKKFICESFKLSPKEFKLKRVTKEVHKKYPYLKFDYSKGRDSFISDNIPTSALVYITDLLNYHKIDFHVSHKNQIIIN